MKEDRETGKVVHKPCLFTLQSRSQSRTHATKLPVWHALWSECFLESPGNLQEFIFSDLLDIKPSVLWRCWLGGRKGIRPVKKTCWWGTGMVICLERGADLHMAQLMSLPLTVFCFSKIQIGFTFLVPAHPGSPGKRALNGCVCVIC